MKILDHFMIPEHHSQLFNNEALSSMKLVREFTAKLNELIDAFNDLCATNLQWKITEEGRINAGIIFMKDNLLNSLNDLMLLFRDNGFIDDRINFHCKAINDRLDNIFKALENGTTVDDVEIIDGRVDFTGKTWNRIGDHLRELFSVIGSVGYLSREQTGAQYNNINLKDDIKTGDLIYVEPLEINVDNTDINYISVMGLYGDYLEEGYDTLGYFLPDTIKPMIFKMLRDYKGIRITYNLTSLKSTLAHGIIKKLSNDFVSNVYKNRIKTYNTRNNSFLFEPVKMRYGAHQGYKEIAPANSLPAYELACSNFDWLWIAGCRQSADGTWYVLHDATIDSTTNKSGAIKEMTDEELKDVYIVTGKNVEKYSKEQLKLPTLEEVLNLCRENGTCVCFRMLSLYTNVTGLEHFKSLIEFVKLHGYDNSIFSGNLTQIERLKSLTDNWHGQVYVDSSNTQDIYDMIDNYVDRGWTNMSILATYEATTKEVVEYCHKHGFYYCVSDIPVNASESAVILELIQKGVDICQSGHITKMNCFIHYPPKA